MTEWANGFAHADHYFDDDNGPQTTSSSRKASNCCNNIQPGFHYEEIFLRFFSSPMFFMRIRSTNIHGLRLFPTGKNGVIGTTSARMKFKNKNARMFFSFSLRSKKGAKDPFIKDYCLTHLSRLPTKLLLREDKIGQKSFLVISLPFYLSVSFSLFLKR